MRTRTALVSLAALLTSSLVLTAAGPAPALRVPEDEERIPDAPFDARHLRLDLTLDLVGRAVSGKATWRLSSLRDGMTSLRLDQVGLEITQVTRDGAPATFRLTDDAVFVQIDPPLRWGEAAEIALSYRATPRHGLHFRGPVATSPHARYEVWSQGEARDNRFWFPLRDHPSDRFTYEGHFTAPREVEVLSNGVLTGADEDGKNKTWRWRLDQTLVSYLVMVAASDYDLHPLPGEGVPMTVWVPPGTDPAVVERQFGATRQMAAFFEQLTGVAYPWPKYDQVVVQDFIFGGMENTTATVLNDRALVPMASTENRSAEELVAHELAHQWYGDLVTCRHWSDLWLNEGLATWMSMAWMRQVYGPQRYVWELWRRREAVVAANQAGAGALIDDLVNRETQDKRLLLARFFATLNYDKGAWLMRMLEAELGDDVFRRGLVAYTRRFSEGSALTTDLGRAFEEISGRDLSAFFDQWARLRGHPAINVRHSWEDGLLKVTLKQTQTVAGLTPLFDVPVTIGWPDVTRLDGFVRAQGRLSSGETTLIFQVPREPAWVAVDPDVALLAEFDHPQPRPAWRAQLKAPVAGPVLEALDALKEVGKDPEDVEAVLAVLTDAQRDVKIRQIAASALAQMTQAGEIALAQVVGQLPDAGLREHSAQALEKAQTPQGKDALFRMARGDPNDRVRAAALTSLGATRDSRALDLARSAIGRDSDMEVLRVAALSVWINSGEPERLPDLVRYAGPEQPRPIRSAALGGVSSLAPALGEGTRADKTRRELSAAITPMLLDPYPGTRRAAASALGAIGDPGALPALENARRLEIADSPRRAQLDAIGALKAGRRPAPSSAPTEGKLTAVEARQEELLRRLDELEAELVRHGIGAGQ